MKKLCPGDVQVGGLFSRTLRGHVGGGYSPALQSPVPPRCPRTCQSSRRPVSVKTRQGRSRRRTWWPCRTTSRRGQPCSADEEPTVRPVRRQPGPISRGPCRGSSGILSGTASPTSEPGQETCCGQQKPQSSGRDIPALTAGKVTASSVPSTIRRADVPNVTAVSPCCEHQTPSGPTYLEVTVLDDAAGRQPNGSFQQAVGDRGAVLQEQGLLSGGWAHGVTPQKTREQIWGWRDLRPRGNGLFCRSEGGWWSWARGSGYRCGHLQPWSSSHRMHRECRLWGGRKAVSTDHNLGARRCSQPPQHSSLLP